MQAAVKSVIAQAPVESEFGQQLSQFVSIAELGREEARRLPGLVEGVTVLLGVLLDLAARFLAREQRQYGVVGGRSRELDFAEIEQSAQAVDEFEVPSLHQAMG